MMIRIGTMIADKQQENKLLKKLIGISIVMKTEFDIAVYSQDFGKLINRIENIDILLVDFGILRINKDRINELYKRNMKCLPVLVGTTRDTVCKYLSIRPAGYIESIEKITPEDESDIVRSICEFFMEITNERFGNKIDNSVLYITTRKDSFAIPKQDILYCQSDLKYTVFVLGSGMLIRKLEKLQSIEENYLWDFKRVHQSFLINPKRVVSLDKTANEIVMENAHRVPFSRKYAANVRDMFKN